MLYEFLENNFIQFPFQLIVSEIIFLIGVQRRNHFFVRLTAGFVLQFTLSYIWMAIINFYTGQSLFPFVFLYLGYAVITIFPIMFSFDIGILEVLFIMAGGYATEHISFTLSKIILFFTNQSFALNGNFAHILITRYLVYIIGAIIVYVLIIRKKQKRNRFQDGDIRIAILAVIVMIAAIGFSVYWSYPEEHAGTLIGEVICPFYSLLCCTLVLLMEYSVLHENNMKQEHEMMEQLLQMSGVQQKSAKEAIDIINIKCHDLKHQIKALENMEDSQARSEYLREIQQAVSIYDATYHTGCKALDYVLREKTLIYNEHNLEFSCMVEGKMIAFMASADVYALMGNALDNALERVLQEAVEERVISLQIKHHNEMVLIHLENRCSHKPEFINGLPVTDKKDKSRHGFGVKSIRYIVEKYCGELLMSVQNGKFSLDILLPINEVINEK